jgi:methyl-accepting chemotaxis protein
VNRLRDTPLRRRLAGTLVGLALVSVLSLAVVNYFVVGTLLQTGVEDKLELLRDQRQAAISEGMEQLAARTAVLAEDPGVVAAFVEMSDAYRDLPDISDAERADLESLYQSEVLSVFDAAGVEHPSVAELLPDSASGRYVQSRYVADNPEPEADREQLTDAGDGSAYSTAHGRVHPFLADAMASTAASDLLFISAEDAEVFYTVDKRIDIGTDTRATGPRRARWRCNAWTVCGWS